MTPSKLTLKTTWIAALLATSAPAWTVAQEKQETTTCEPGERVTVMCRTAQKCEASIGKGAAYDALKNESAVVRADRDTKAAGLLMCHQDKGVLQSALLNAQAEKKSTPAQGVSAWVGVGAMALFTGSVWLATEALVDDAPDMTQAIVAGVFTVAGGGIITFAW